MDQKKIFKEFEGDAWFERNKATLSNKDYKNDPLATEIINLVKSKTPKDNKKINILEIGCGDGGRGKYILNSISCNYYGIDPSKKAIAVAKSNGLITSVGTAEQLPFEDKKFDIIVYGFCLYLCDRKDLSLIRKEASRVLKNFSWLLIMDFFSDQKYENEYSHYENIKSYKMDYRKIFTSDKSFLCYSHKIIDHETHKYTDLKDNWVSVSLIRRQNSDS